MKRENLKRANQINSTIIALETKIKDLKTVVSRMKSEGYHAITIHFNESESIHNYFCLDNHFEQNDIERLIQEKIDLYNQTIKGLLTELETL